MLSVCDAILQSTITSQGNLTFMQQSKGWVEGPFSLSEEEQLSIHCQDFNVFVAAGRITLELGKQ